MIDITCWLQRTKFDKSDFRYSECDFWSEDVYTGPGNSFYLQEPDIQNFNYYLVRNKMNIETRLEIQTS
jgi:hypothetical protein